jgi:hypothetical protein
MQNKKKKNKVDFSLLERKNGNSENSQALSGVSLFAVAGNSVRVLRFLLKNKCKLTHSLVGGGR